jgi:hypothetical protein
MKDSMILLVLIVIGVLYDFRLILDLHVLMV